MTVKEAKELDMVDYLSSIGFKPQKISGKNYWYLSPLGQEKTPSFKINRALNRWYDFSNGKGGNLVDFGIAYHRCSVADFLGKLDNGNAGLTPVQVNQRQINTTEDNNNAIKILRVKPILSLPLFKYLKERRIPQSIAHQYLQEVDYQLKDKKYYALGFKNDSGGYELRNQYIKASSSPKDSTFFDNHANNLAVFEGFFNFLAYQKINADQPSPDRNYLILNSTSFFEKNLPRMQNHQTVHLYLDNDATGQKFTQQVQAINPEKFKDERKLYQNYKDLNDWITHIGQSQKQKQKP